MTLLELIEKTKQDIDSIRAEYRILEDYQKANPWHILESIEDMKSKGFPNVPSFNDAIKFKEDMLMDSLSKIYNQIKKNNPDLLDRGAPEVVYFYTIRPGFFKKQLKKGFQLGAKDDMGFLITGINVIVETATVNIHEFLESYYMLHN